jgi:hypothetical protein
MSATIVPFPSTRRIHAIRNAAAYMSCQDASGSEGHLKAQLTRLETRLRKAGVSEDLIAQERKAYELAVRAELWRCVLTPGRGA